MVILENIDIDIDIDKAILQNIDIDKISNRFKFGISNRATVAPNFSPHLPTCIVTPKTISGQKPNLKFSRRHHMWRSLQF